MTRDEFDLWLDDRKEDVLDDMAQSDTTPQKWLARLYAALVATANEESKESRPGEDDDEDEHDPEREAENSNDMDDGA
jgi:hypothetical protein